jgi:hypothetical protein
MRLHVINAPACHQCACMRHTLHRMAQPTGPVVANAPSFRCWQQYIIIIIIIIIHHCHMFSANNGSGTPAISYIGMHLATLQLPSV